MMKMFRFGAALLLAGVAASPAFAQSGVGPNTVVGTFGGSANVYTMTPSWPAITVNAANLRMCGFFPSSLAKNTGTATFALGSASALPVRVRSAQSGLLALTGGEMTGGTNGNTYCASIDNSNSFWVLDSSPLATQTVNPTSPYSVTQADWAAGASFLITAASTTITLPNLSLVTLSANAGILIQTAGVPVTLAAQGSDVINTGLISASSAGGSITLPADGEFLVSTSGTAGSTAFTVPLGPIKNFDITWAEGLNLSTNARFMGKADVQLTVYSMSCNVQAAAGSTSTVTIYSTPSGTAPASGTNLTNTATCDANTANNADQTPTGTNKTITAGNNVWAVFSGSGTSGNGGFHIRAR